MALILDNKEELDKEIKVPVNENNSEIGIILYTDGSVRPTNPGYGGWGVHGYTYNNIFGNTLTYNNCFVNCSC